jgi:hypothetical protein
MFPLTSSVTLTNGQFYWLGIWSDDANARVYHSGNTGTLRWGRYDYGGWPDPISTTSGGSLNYCIYASGFLPPTLASIEVTPINPTIQGGDTQQFAAVGAYTDASAVDITSQVTWISSNALVATVSASGLATGVSVGTTTIAALLNDVTGGTRLTVGKTNALVNLENLIQTYDGTARIVTATTVPAGLPVEIKYDGSSTAPINVGSYQVVGTVNHTAYEGSATNTLTIVDAPRLLGVSESPEGTFTAVWEVQPGRTYRFQYKEDLTDAGWIIVGEDFTANMSTATFSESTGANRQRFYRLVDTTSP